MASDTAPTRERFLDIDRAKGLAIALVVLGHLTARGEYFTEQWYSTLKFVIYMFHMPFFMYLSGFIFFASGSQRKWPAGYPKFVEGRAVRLIVPGLAIGLIILGLKFGLSQFMGLANAPEGLYSGLLEMFLSPSTGPVQSIWYVFALFIYCLVTPVLFWAVRGRMPVLLVLGLLIHFVILPDAFFLQKAGYNYVYFLIGGYVYLHREAAYRFFRRFFVPLAIVFLISLTAVFWDVPTGVKVLAPGFLSIPVLHQLVISVFDERASVLAFLGKYSFVIYLLNTLFIGGGRVLLALIAPLTGAYFVLCAILLTLLGILGPILAKRVVFDRAPLLKRMTD